MRHGAQGEGECTHAHPGRKKREAGRIGTEEYFETLVCNYEKLVYSICLKMTDNPFDAQDLAQDTFLSAYKKLPEFDGTFEKAWITRIATNKCLDFLKSAARRSEPKEEEYFAQITDQEAGPEEECLRQEAKQYVLQVCAKLRPPYDEIARKHFYEEKSASEIAGETGKNIKTVQTQIYRAKALIKKQLKGGGA